jgi:signal transduction histidine kinase
MKRKLIALSQRYLAALKVHLKQGPCAKLGTARGMGRRALGMGLETLDMARIHDGALATLEASSPRDGIIEQAELFFKEAITPIEEMHRAALEANANLNHVNKTLGRRTLDLAASNQSLKQNILRRKTAEEVLKKTGGHSQKLLQESHRFQKHLQSLAHQVMKAHEGNRKRISRDLQDEIAQTLLGVNVRLLTLRKEAALNAKGFKKDISNTQRLVDKSVKSIKRFAREFGKHREA